MKKEPQGVRRRGRRLLIAAIGVATVSFVETQSGCAVETDSRDGDLEGKPYDDEPETEARELGSAQQALSGVSLQAAQQQTVIRYKIPFPPGNLMAPVEIEKIPIPVGNLMVTPVDVLNEDLVANPVLEEVQR